MKTPLLIALFATIFISYLPSNPTSSREKDPYVLLIVTTQDEEGNEISGYSAKPRIIQDGHLIKELAEKETAGRSGDQNWLFTLPPGSYYVHVGTKKHEFTVIDPIVRVDILLTVSQSRE